VKGRVRGTHRRAADEWSREPGSVGVEGAGEEERGSAPASEVAMWRTESEGLGLDRGLAASGDVAVGGRRGADRWAGQG